MQQEFPSDVTTAILKGCKQTDSYYVNKSFEEYQVTHNLLSCKSGSCANMILTVNNDIYVVNVGDSRAIGSRNNGNQAIDLSFDHKPCDEAEFKRIEAAGGYIYQTHSIINAAGRPALQ